MTEGAAEWRLFRRHCPNADELDERIFGATLRQFGAKITAMALDRAANWGSCEVTAKRVRAIAKDLTNQGWTRAPRESSAGRQAPSAAGRRPGQTPAQKEAADGLVELGYKRRLAERVVGCCGAEGDAETILAAALKEMLRIRKL